MLTRVYIPEFITVHLGAPNSNAQDVTVGFPDYIKNVASSEIFPTWPEASLRANIYAQISFALNRVYTEWYRSRGYAFDITSSTQYDQSFVFGRDIFDSISSIVDDIFNNYLRRYGSVEPLFAQFCNGTTVTCEGLSQWGSVELARSGMTPYEILVYYYGDDVQIIRDAPVQAITESFPGYPISRGLEGNDVKFIQIRLNRISVNYPLIPKIPTPNGLFGPATENAVRAFQEIFNLTVDGIVGKATWYKVNFIYVNVKRLAELSSEGLSLADISKQFPDVLQQGMTGPGIQVLQYFLTTVANFNPSVPPVAIDGVFGQETENAVRAFQQDNGLIVDGIVGRETWAVLYSTYRGIEKSIPPRDLDFPIQPYPGVVLRQGMRGDSIALMQDYLSVIASFYPSIPSVPSTGFFGPQTYQSVSAFQREFGLAVDGIVGPGTWNAITRIYSDLANGSVTRQGQFPGMILREQQPQG